MDYSKITSIDQIQREKQNLSRKIQKKEHQLDTSFILAKHHAKDMLSVPIIIRSIISRILSIDTLFSHPSDLFRAGTALGRKVASIFKRK